MSTAGRVSDVLEEVGYEDFYGAAADGNMAAVRALAGVGADVEKRNKNNFTVAFGAAKAGELKVLTYLVEKCEAQLRPTLAAGNASILHWSAAYGHFDVVKVSRHRRRLCGIAFNTTRRST